MTLIRSVDHRGKLMCKSILPLVEKLGQDRSEADKIRIKVLREIDKPMDLATCRNALTRVNRGK